MDNKEFDKNIREKLENLKTNSTSNDWEDFSKILSKEEGFEDIEFDEMVSDSLKNQKTPYNSLHWILLKNRLEKEARLRKEIFTTKLLESLLVFLLIFTFSNLGRYVNLDRNHPNDVIQYANIQLLDFPEISRQNIVLNSNNAELKVLAPFSQQNRDVENDNLALENRKNEVAVSTISNQEVLSYQDNNAKELVASLNSEEIEIVHTVPSLYSKGISNRSSYQLNEIYPSFFIKEKEEMDVEKSITAAFNTNFSIVRTPRDYDFTVDPYRNYNMDFGAGVEYSTRRKNTGLAVGLTYTKVSYEPIKISEISGGFNEDIVKNTFDRIEFDLVQVPLNIRYHFDRPERKTHFWSGIGMAINMAFYARYNIETVVVAPAPSSVSGTQPDGHENERSGSRLEQKNFHPGLLESGSFFDNMFVSVNVDVGLESELTQRLSLTSSIGYYKALTALGLGPNNDVLDAMKVGVGLKYKI